MGSVLESCLNHRWGHSYLFEFGLSLQKGDEQSSDEDNRISQFIVSEFSHFKEVMTMVWNEETSQKPVEDTIDGIVGRVRSLQNMIPLQINKNSLIECYRVFDSNYKILLGEYIKPNANLNELIRNTITLVNRVKPRNFSCDSEWNAKVKQEIPSILACIFTVFTVLKSGASYNRTFVLIWMWH